MNRELQSAIYSDLEKEDGKRFMQTMREIDELERIQKNLVRQMLAAYLRNPGTQHNNIDFEGGVYMENKTLVQYIEKLERVRMKGLKIPSVIVSGTGWLHARQNKVIIKEGTLSSNWLERKQKNFNAYCATMLKIIGNELLPLRTELLTIENIHSENICKLAEMEEKLLNMQPISVKEKREYETLKKSIVETKNERNINEGKIKELKLAINELEHESFQLVQKTKGRAESIILTYLQGAKLLVDNTELLKDAMKESELYMQYCKYENELIEREGE